MGGSRVFGDNKQNMFGEYKKDLWMDQVDDRLQ